MKKIKYTIAGSKAEGVIMIDNIINITPGDRADNCYIQTIGKTIKTGNTVAEIDARIDAVIKSTTTPAPIINVSAPEVHIAPAEVNVQPAQVTVQTPAVNISGTTFKAILQNRRLLYVSLNDAASKAKLVELDTLLTLV